MMIFLRSTLYMVVMTVITTLFATLMVFTFPFKVHTRYRIISRWACWIAMPMTRLLLGIDHKVIGRENLPAGPAVILSKHQSAWETISFQEIFPPVAYVLKKELLRIPGFGWGLAQMPIISIDRSAGKDALRQVLDQGKQRLQEGFWVVVYPEGTRAAIGTAKRYKVGGAALAVEAGAPVVPVAHNAGEFWRRNAWLKRPGVITVSIGPVIQTQGRSAEAVNTEVEAWIEGEMRRLFPHHYRSESAAAGQPAGATAR